MKILDKPTESQLDERFRGMAVDDLIAQFPPHCLLDIYTVFPGEFRAGYKFGSRNYLPGTPSYYPLKEALQRCLWAFQSSENTRDETDGCNIETYEQREAIRISQRLPDGSDAANVDENSRGLAGVDLPKGFEVILIDYESMMHVSYRVKIDKCPYVVGKTIPLRASEEELVTLCTSMMEKAMQYHIERVMASK